MSPLQFSKSDFFQNTPPKIIQMISELENHHSYFTNIIIDTVKDIGKNDQ